MNLTGLLNFQTSFTKDDQDIFLIASSLKEVVEEFFTKVAPSFVIVCSCRRKNTFYFIQSIMQVFFSIVVIMPVQIIYIDHKSPLQIKGPRIHNLLLVDSFEAFLDIDVISFSQNYTNNEYHHIFLLQRDQYVQQDMKSIFKYCWTNNIVNCNIQHQNANAEIFLYTFFPFTIDKCGNYDPQLIDTFIGKSWTNKTYFQRKLNNFYGCPLVAIVRDAPPYTFVNMAANGTVSFHGLEIDMFKLLAKKMNFTLHLRARIVDNHIIPFDSEALKMVANRTADVAFGFYHRRAGEDNQFSTTFPHMQTKAVAVIYLPAHFLNIFEVLLYPFEDYVWYGVILSVVIILAVTGLMGINRTESISLFSMISCALGLPIQHQPKLPFSILIFITWLWSSFILRLIYSELWFQLLRYKIYSFLPKTLGEVVDNNYEAVMNYFMYNEIKDTPMFNNTLNRTSIVLPPYEKESFVIAYLRESSIKNLFAVTFFDFFIYFINRNNTRRLFHVIPETVMRQYLCFYMAKHSYFIPQFDWEIKYLQASGLLKFWSRTHFDYNYMVKEEMYRESEFEQEDLWGIYVVCCVLYLIAIIIFLIEVLSQKITFFARLFN